MNWERLQQARLVEQKLDMTTPAATLISQAIIKTAEADTRAALAEVVIRKAKQQEICEDCDSFDSDRMAAEQAQAQIRTESKTQTQTQTVASGSSTPPKSPIVYQMTPLLSDLIDWLRSLPEDGREGMCTVIRLAIETFYRVETLVEERKSHGAAERVQRAPRGRHSANDTIPEAGTDSPASWAVLEETRYAEDIWPEDELRYVANDSKLLPLLREASPADRAASSAHLETLLLLAESTDMFWVHDQTAAGAASSPLGITPRDFEVLQEYVAVRQAMSPQARTIVKKFEDFAFNCMTQLSKFKDALAQFRARNNSQAVEVRAPSVRTQVDGGCLELRIGEDLVQGGFQHDAFQHDQTKGNSGCSELR